MPVILKNSFVKVVRFVRNNLFKTNYNSVLHRAITAMDPVIENNVDGDILASKDATRYKNRIRKRQWDDSSNETEAKKSCGEPTERIKKKKMAMLLGYSGVNYLGMQRNPGVPTIEEDLLKALFEAKYFSEAEFKNQQNAQFQRSSRTDKGVSAARQVVSLKMPLEANIEEINKRLPDCIRVFSLKRVTKGFNSKQQCNARTYSYTVPTYAFDSAQVTAEQRRGFRISKEMMEKVEGLLSHYKGTKCYHNFTEKKQYLDPSASRYMISFGVAEVFVDKDMEFATLVVKGQSFMIHQIRKMVGLVIAVLRGHIDSSIMERAFSKERVMVPIAPGLGLVLDMVHYDQYDTKYKTTHDSLTWEAEEEIVKKFRKEHIYPNIVKGEIEDDSMGVWLEKLATHTYEPSDEANGQKTSVVEVDSKEKEDGHESEGIDENKVLNNDNEKQIDDIKCT